MKILPVIDTHRIGGPGKGLIALVKSLRPYTEIPGVVVFHRATNGPSDFIRALEANGIEPLILHERSAIDRHVLKRLTALVREHRPDVIQTHGYKASFLAFLLKLLRRLPKQISWVAWLHGWTSENLKMRVYTMIEKCSVIFADKIICVAGSLSKKIRAPKRKVSIIHNGIDASYSALPSYNLTKFRDDLKIADRKLIVVIGRYSFEKGQDRIPAIANELKKITREKFVFLLIGEGPEENKLVELIDQNGLADEIRLHPYLSDIRPFYLLADVCLLPSRSEGMPNVILEALYLRCPVVSFDVGGVTEIIQHTAEGLIVEQDNIIALAQAIHKVFSEPHLSDTMRDAGHRKICKQFLNSTKANRVIKTYEELCLGKHSAQKHEQ